MCRGTDTAARYGGDEFDLVLPETREESAPRVHTRLRAELANDRTLLPLSVSVGLAMCRADGTSLTPLLEVVSSECGKGEIPSQRGLGFLGPICSGDAPGP